MTEPPYTIYQLADGTMITPEQVETMRRQAIALLKSLYSMQGKRIKVVEIDTSGKPVLK